ncbi:MAG: MFS transporter [Elusimicrobiota bacterium]
MNTRFPLVFKRCVGAFLSGLILLGAPGEGAYRAFATQVVSPVMPIEIPLSSLGLGGAANGNAAGRISRTVLPVLMGTLPGVAPMPARGAILPSVQVTLPSDPAALDLPASLVGGEDAAARFPQSGRLRPSGGGNGSAGVDMPAWSYHRSDRDFAGEIGSAQTGAVSEILSGQTPVVDPNAASLHPFRGKENTLNTRFQELRQEFSAGRELSDVLPSLQTSGALLARAVVPGSLLIGHAGSVKAAFSGDYLSRKIFTRLERSKPGLALKLHSEPASKDVPAPVVRLDSEPDASEQTLAQSGKTHDLALPESAIPTEKSNGITAETSGESVVAQAAGNNVEAKAGLGRTAWWFISAQLVAQVAAETLGSSMPALVKKVFGDFTVVADLAIFISLAGIIGRQIAPVVIGKYGLSKAYHGALILRTASISALIGLLMTGNMTLPLMMALSSLNAMLQGVTATALYGIPPALVGQKQSALEGFWAREHTLVEIMGVAGPILTGLAISNFGFVPALIAFPISMLASMLITGLTLRLPPEADLKMLAPQQQGGDGVFKAFFKKIGRGAQVVWKAPALRYSFLGYALVLMLNPFLYQIFSYGYGMFIAGAANAELAAEIAGWLPGFYSFGGLLAGFYMTAQTRKVKQDVDAGRLDDAAAESFMRKSMLRWLLGVTASLVMLVPMMFHLPVLGSLIALPASLAWAQNITLPALTLLPFGMAQVVSYFKLQNFFQANVKKEDQADAMGFLGAGYSLTAMIGTFALKYVFKTAAPFYYVSLLLIPLAIGYLLLHHNLSKIVKSMSVSQN